MSRDKSRSIIGPGVIEVGTEEGAKAPYRADNLRHPRSFGSHQHGYQLHLLHFAATPSTNANAYNDHHAHPHTHS